MAEAKAPKAVRYKLAKGKGLKIPGVGFDVTNENVNDPNVLLIITKAEGRTGNKYIGRAIVEA